MKIRILTVLILAAVLPGVLGPAPCLADDEWDDSDKAVHAGVSFAVATAAYNFYKKNTEMTDLQARGAAFLTTVAAGAVKELADDEFSEKDLAADAAGAAIGVAVGFEF